MQNGSLGLSPLKALIAASWTNLGAKKLPDLPRLSLHQCPPEAEGGRRDGRAGDTGRLWPTVWNVLDPWPRIEEQRFQEVGYGGRAVLSGWTLEL